MATRRRVLGDDHIDTLRIANCLTLVLRESGEHERARDLAQDALTRYRRVQGDDHPHTLASARNLALILDTLSEHAQAHELKQWIKHKHRT